VAFKEAVSRRLCSSARGGRVVYGRIHILGTGGWVDAPTLGRYSEPRFFLDGVPAVIVRLARQRSRLRRGGKDGSQERSWTRQPGRWA